MRILFFGTSPFALVTLEALLKSAHTVVGVVTQPDRPRGRNQAVSPPPVAVTAQAAEIPLLQPEKLKEAKTLDSIKAFGAEVGVVVAYGRLLPPELLALFPKGMFNLHASLLPKYRGAAPIAWALIRGESSTGVTIFKIDERLDHGPILLQKKLAIEPYEERVALGNRLAQIGSETFLEALDQIESGSSNLQPQSEAEVTLAPILTRELSFIDWQDQAVTLHNLIRGLQPWPGALTSWQGKLLKLLACTPETQQREAAPGTILLADPKAGLLVQTGQGQLRLDRLQLEGGRVLSAAEFLRGHPLQIGERLG